ncbi:MAG: hypothetical protein IPH44_17840 [Myxococcales bacterium]|nr:hypothetical protein [Myxococcales bacterium]MBK7196769.1 hypothetical protein [Myxococcales bacterium]MBP6844561.1 hypothetical protein [Kofleriaceae bacterium]
MRPSHRPACRPTLLLVVCASLAAACGAGKYPAVATTSAPPGPRTGVAMAPPAPPPPSLTEANVAVPGPTPAAPPDERPGLATTWGETTWSPITTTPFVRAGAAPWATAVLRYNDRDGVAAHAAYVGASLAPLAVDVGAGDVAVSLIDDGGAILPGVVAGGRNLVAALDGARYRIAIANRTTARFEVVASVDGLDVIDGQPAGFDRRGYVVEPGAELIIDGFRQSASEVAAFRFGKVAASYAARTAGDANVGVVGVALFAERGAVWTPAELERRDRADPFPGEPGRGFAASP